MRTATLFTLSYETLAPTVPPLEFSSTRLVGVMVRGSIGSEKPTSIGVHGLISVTGPVSGGNAFGLPAVMARNFDPLVGYVVATFGDDVWKFQLYTLASGTPAADLIVVMSRAV